MHQPNRLDEMPSASSTPCKRRTKTGQCAQKPSDESLGLAVLNKARRPAAIFSNGNDAFFMLKQ